MGTEENMKTCFGDIYPDLEKFQFGRPLIGKVFQISVDTIGPGQKARKLSIDMDAWQECRQCEDFQSCYDFSSAKLQMQCVLRDL
jgi:sulfatase maturation enzyme AslB (radical SAM superfamily)